MKQKKKKISRNYWEGTSGIREKGSIYKVRNVNTNNVY